jgi:hypothetical protein
METDVAYFAGRALEERLAARKASNEAARRSHVGMAERYEELATAIRDRETALGFNLTGTNEQLRMTP